jgi:hypothetical protein
MKGILSGESIPDRVLKKFTEFQGTPMFTGILRKAIQI